MIKFSIVIPSFNEGVNIRNIIKEINFFLSDKYTYEIIVVDDASSDKSVILDELLKLSKLIKIIKHKRNLGQSQSILSGIKESIYENIITIDADGQNNPKDIESLINIYINNNLSLVCGVRLKRKDNFLKILSSKIANKIRMNILNDNCVDTGCSLKIFKKKIFLKLPFFDGIHRFIQALYLAYNSKMEFIAVDHRPRINGKSNYGNIDRAIKGIVDIFRVKKIINEIKNNK